MVVKTNRKYLKIRMSRGNCAVSRASREQQTPLGTSKEETEGGMIREVSEESAKGV